MSFSADHEAIRRYGHAIRALADDADAANSYAKKALSIGYNEGRMFFTVVETATTIRDALTANFEQLAKLVDASAMELDKTANGYRDTDLENAARIDATYKR